MRVRRLFPPAVPMLIVLLLGFAAACSTKENNGGVTPVTIPATSMNYIVLAWNDVGMPFFSPTYDKEVLLPPYSTLWAQVIKRGDPPEIVTTGITIEYSVIGNTYSYGKMTADPLRIYAGFWDRSLSLFGVDLAPDTGLNFSDPATHNGLSGAMVLKDTHFEAVGIPVVPIKDDGTWDPYQVAEIVVRDAGTNAELVRTQATLPTSDEISCGKCHGTTVGTQEVLSVLEEHDKGTGTTFAVEGQPVLCAACHGSPALGQTGPGSTELYLSQVIHGFHSTTSAACYDCHPGKTTLFHRSTAHTTATGACTDCHGSLTSIATGITDGRVPWTGEPACSDCHTFVTEVPTGTTLYHSATGHGGVSCPACHGSPHATIPSNKEVDHYQFLQYQAKALPFGSCKVCHANSKGGGLIGVAVAHGTSEPTSCNVCHTGPITTNNPVNFPHRFQQRQR
jgi:Cytochrome c554 and c-prime